MPVRSPHDHSPLLLGERRAQTILERVMMLSKADETEAALSASTEALTRFARNAIHQNVAEVDALLEVRAAFGARVGVASTNNLSPEGIARAVGTACTIARHVPENPYWPGLPQPQLIPDILAFDEAAAALCIAPEARARMVADICRAARSSQLWASGAFSTGWTEYAVMNSKGLFVYAPQTDVDLTFVVEQPSESTSAYAHAAGWRLSQIDIEALKRQAIDRALANRNPRSIAPGEYPVVLEPYAVVSLIEALAEAGMGALAVQEKRSWMNGRIGRKTLSPLISIYDDAFDPEGCPQAFDCEGVPKQLVPIVVKGVPTSPVYDRFTAAREDGRISTGHAQPYDEDWDGPLPENLSMAAGETSVEDLIGAIDRGLYITRLWYVNLTRPHNCGVTGTTRDGVWWIENGELAYPVANMRIDQEVVKALKHVRGVGRERRTLAGFFGGVHRMPALALDGFRLIEAGE